MSAALTDIPVGGEVDHRHEALFYDGEDGFVRGVAPFITEGAEAGEPVLAVVGAHKIDMLRDALGDLADRVFFADMLSVGRNPARTIPAWQEFLDAHGGRGRLRGVGEPIWATRSAAELVESQRHESLLNVAFAGSGAWWLLCPYDTSSLGEAVLYEARRSHPYLSDAQGQQATTAYQAEQMPQSHLDAELPEPARALEELVVGPEHLGRLRAAVSRRVRQFGLDEDRAADLVLAVHEVAANTVVHGGGAGVFRLWREAKSLVCELRDTGRIDRPLIGRQAPAPDIEKGRGLWLANQVCDLVQIRSFPTGSVVRLHMSLDNR
jgi:anti-sigma regulatory factor (Ser/Thr protein kinase)